MSDNVYATLEELQAQLDAPDEVRWASGDVDNLNIALKAASRWIDAYCGTRFYTGDDETRYYTAAWHDLLYVDDLVSLTTLATDEDDDGVYETAWAATDYVLEPRNAAGDGRPYRQIRINRRGRYSFPARRDAVAVTGAFGYSAAPPDAIKQACLLVAHRLWMRRTAIFGIAGTPGLGVTVVQAKILADSDVTALLDAIDVRRV